MNTRIAKNSVRIDNRDYCAFVREHMIRTGQLVPRPEVTKAYRKANKMGIEPFFNRADAPVFRQGELTAKQICRDHSLECQRLESTLSVRIWGVAG